MRENIFVQYLTWHFYDAARGVLNIWKNFLRFNLNYWSLPLLLKTLFAPWRRYNYSYGRGFDPKRFFEVFTFNTISRVMGLIMRTVLIVCGLLTEAFVFLAGAAGFLIWLFLPVLILIGFYHGCRLLF